ncbi:hypothetical protein ACIZ62_13875 [Acetobacterium carbinolicum]|uniref:hypothetical protein n=1 Tax=Acetobacterium carbinolicum TaxID=52690 RepID=UPI000CAA3828|nr:MAG: hypothetical protein CVU92_09080 [Firmicutes bacterium HGW-Firmicutes-17]
MRRKKMYSCLLNRSMQTRLLPETSTMNIGIELLDVMTYHTPINPFMVWNHFVPPRSFRYI